MREMVTRFGGAVEEIVVGRPRREMASQKWSQ
jgi:hypothetical protein